MKTNNHTNRNQNQTPSSTPAVRRPFKPNLGIGPYPISGKNLYKIYPDNWNEKWGVPPLLGVVTADDEFYAVRAAYDRGLLSVNFSFTPRAVYAKKAKIHRPT
jgi:hypothetical protein